VAFVRDVRDEEHGRGQLRFLLGAALGRLEREKPEAAVGSVEPLASRKKD